MKKESKRKTSIKSSILILLLIAILLISSTYAWFTANKTVTISDINGDNAHKVFSGRTHTSNGVTLHGVDHAVEESEILNNLYLKYNDNETYIKFQPLLQEKNEKYPHYKFCKKLCPYWQ